MVERMLAAGIGGLPPRVAAWCAGHVPDEELLKEIEAERLRSAANSGALRERNPMDTPTASPAEPGIDIRKLKAGTVILLEAEP